MRATTPIAGSAPGASGASGASVDMAAAATARRAQTALRVEEELCARRHALASGEAALDRVEIGDECADLDLAGLEVMRFVIPDGGLGVLTVFDDVKVSCVAIELNFHGSHSRCE